MPPTTRRDFLTKTTTGMSAVALAGFSGVTRAAEKNQPLESTAPIPKG
ncbi:MAG: twin-arginine translocation signal domain-containing protein, partial [Planctomycetes bacterium]|nr:twin-arginine translocation signal domain-containing protein [Planctomycetota bacterium]